MTDIWLFYYFADLAEKMPILAHLGKIFGGFDLINVVRYCGDPKRHILCPKHAFWRMDRLDRSRNATWARAEKKNKK